MTITEDTMVATADSPNGMTEAMLRFVNAAFNDFDPILQRVSAELQAQR